MKCQNLIFIVILTKRVASLRILPYTLLYTCTCAYICVRKIQQVISHIALSRLVMISPQGQIALSLG